MKYSMFFRFIVPALGFVLLIFAGCDLKTVEPYHVENAGDINDNGTPNEIADAVMFTNYFINGLSAFGDHVNSSIVKSDVNEDGKVLGVADLVYLVRVITGDANPYPKPLPECVVELVLSGNQVIYDAEIDMGAAWLILQVDGEVGSPFLGSGASAMDLKYAREDNELSVLVYSIGTDAIRVGENILLSIPLNGDIELAYAEFATWDGYPMTTEIRNIHHEPYLGQNYPNPFNESTTIPISFPTSADYSLVIKSATGVTVRSWQGHTLAGVLDIVWDATDRSGNPVREGIYLYTVKIGDFEDTKTMVYE